MAEKVRIHSFIRGTIRNGGFTEVVKRSATHLGINGQIKHLPDRRVELFAEGEKPILEKFLEELRYGEVAAQITDIQTTWEEATGEFSGFLVR